MVDSRSRNGQNPRNLSDVVPRDLKEEADIILLELPERWEIGVLVHGFKVEIQVAYHVITSFSPSGPSACCRPLSLMKSFMILGL